MIFIRFAPDLERELVGDCAASEILDRVLQAIGLNEDVFRCPNIWRIITGIHECGGNFQVVFISPKNGCIKCVLEPLRHGGCIDDMMFINMDDRREPVAFMQKFQEDIWSR